MSDAAIDLAGLAAAYATALGEDLTALVGSEVGFEDPRLDDAEPATATEAGCPVVHTTVYIDGAPDQALHLLVGQPEAIALAVLVKGLGVEALEEKRAAGIEGEVLDAYGEAMELVSGGLGRVQRERGLSALQRGESRAHEAGGAEEWLPEGRYHRVRLAMRLPEGFGDGNLDVLIAEELGAIWFADPAANSAAAEAPDANAESNDASEELGTIVVVDGDEESRRQAETLEDTMGCTVWTFDPSEFGTDAFEEVLDADALIVDWDLGGLCGVDLVETWVRDPRTRHIPALVVSSEPTRAMVIAAFRGGARGFAFKPYDADELGTRLAAFMPGLAIAAASAPADEGEPEAGPERSDGAAGEDAEGVPEAAQEAAEAAGT